MSIPHESLIVIYTTCPDSATAESITSKLLQAKQVACVNLLPGIKSQYWWEGKIQKDKEVLVILKTRQSLFKAVEETIKNNHPYQIPEIIALPILQGNASYVSWIHDSVRPPRV